MEGAEGPLGMGGGDVGLGELQGYPHLTKTPFPRSLASGLIWEVWPLPWCGQLAGLYCRSEDRTERASHPVKMNLQGDKMRGDLAPGSPSPSPHCLFPWEVREGWDPRRKQPRPYFSTILY